MKNYETIEFGNYPQSANGGAQKILWRILDSQNGQSLLLSEKILDARYWQTTLRNVPKTGKKADMQRAMIPWEECDLRAWLNGEFYDRAFNADEKNKIAQRQCGGNGAYLHHDYVAKKLHKMNANMLATDSYAAYEERGCADTLDKVFLLSVDEAINFFDKSITIPNTKWSANSSRLAKPTDYVLKQGTYDPEGKKYHPIIENKTGYYKGADFVVVPEFSGFMGWYLRSVGSNDQSFHFANTPNYHGQLSYVTHLGAICASGAGPRVLGIGVRPAILVNNS